MWPQYLNVRDMDRWTDGVTVAIPHYALWASHGKNRSMFAKVIAEIKVAPFFCGLQCIVVVM